MVVSERPSITTMRILYVHSTLVPPPTDLQMDRFCLLSEGLEGDVLQPIWFQTAAEVEEVFGAGSYPVYTVGKFRYHWLLGSNHRTTGQKLRTFRSYLRKGLQLHREQRFDCIVAYSHMTTGLLAGVLKLLTRTKLVIEIATNPHLVYITNTPTPGWRERVMKTYSDMCLHLSVWMSDRLHFLFPNQLSHYPLLRNARNSVFHEFVPVSAVDRVAISEDRGPYVLLVGAPWYPKGADLLIAAFQSLSPDFPDVKLKILGHFPDQEQLQRLIGGSPRIEILKARAHLEALQVIGQAMVLVLPSRCEGMGRVLIEGMAAGIPVIGSEVGGIPYMVHDGENGFLFPVEDSQALSIQLRKLLEDPALRRRMGDRGYELAHGELDEKTYVREFIRMIEATVQGGK
jgi:glycosyltransferase involved in cell wall biosynthesis